jgi:dTDP-glucose 4,6-dehydratase
VDRILVTGCLGVVGTALTSELRRLGHSVVGCDVRHAEMPDYHRCDVADYRVLNDLCQDVRPTLVYHLAGEFGRVNGERHYESLWRTNVVGTKNILRLQERDRFRMVFFSSSEIYGDIDAQLDEDLPDRRAIRPLNDYAISKWVSELQILNSASVFGTETVRVRLFNTYGPGETYTPFRSVVCQFVFKALHELPYVVYASNTRSFTYIDDAIAALASIQSNFKSGEVYNIGASRSHTVRELSDLILSQLGRDDSLVTYLQNEPHNALHKKVSNVKAIRDLGFSESVDLAEGVARTIRWQREHYGRPR